MDTSTVIYIASGVGGGLALLCCCSICCVWGIAFHPGRRRRAPRDRRAPTVLLVGDSLTQATISCPWAEELARRVPNCHVENTGINGDPSYRILERLPDCIQRCSNLKVAIVLCGTNDTIAMLHPKLAATLYKGKLGDSPASVAAYESNLRALIKMLVRQEAGVIVISPPPLGEILPPAAAPLHPSYGPLAALPNELIGQVAAAAKRVAVEEECTYVPLYEELVQCLPTTLERAGRPPCEFNAGMAQLAQAALTVLKYKLLGRSWDSLSSCAHTHDCIHLNERGGAILLDLLMPRLLPLVPSAAASNATAAGNDTMRSAGQSIRTPLVDSGRT